MTLIFNPLNKFKVNLELAHRPKELLRQFRVFCAFLFSTYKLPHDRRTDVKQTDGWARLVMRPIRTVKQAMIDK